MTLTSDGNLILRGSRIVIPLTLRQHLVNTAHESHCGVSKTKSIMRDKVYFQGLDELVETTLRNCLPHVKRLADPPPLKVSSLPPDPWHTVNMDFLGPLPDGSHLLVVIDQRSRFPEVEIVGTTSAHSTREVRQNIRHAWTTQQSDNRQWEPLSQPRISRVHET